MFEAYAGTLTNDGSSQGHSLSWKVALMLYDNAYLLMFNAKFYQMGSITYPEEGAIKV